MKALIVATSNKPLKYNEELQAGQRYRIEYLELSERLPAEYVDYDPPAMHTLAYIRKLEAKFHADFYWARQIARKVKQEKFDIVLSMSERIAVPLGVVLDPHVRHFTLLHNTMGSKWRLAIKLLGLQKRWTQIWVFSQAEVNALKKDFSIDSDKISNISFYVDLNFFNSNGREADPGNVPFILSQGLAKRDYPTLIRAMQKLPHVACQISAVSAWDKFKAGYEDMDIPSNVELKVLNHPSVIRDVLACAQFAVIPLQTDTGVWCAGLSSVLQAQAMGKPVIVTHLPGIAEYVKHGETGYLVKGNDPEAMADAIDRLWKNPQLVKEMGRNAQQWVRESFSLDTWMDRVAALIKKTVDADTQDVTSTEEIKTTPRVFT